MSLLWISGYFIDFFRVLRRIGFVNEGDVVGEGGRKGRILRKWVVFWNFKEESLRKEKMYSNFICWRIKD